MGKILLAVSDRWIPDSRVDAIADFATRLGHPILVMHVAFGSSQTADSSLPGEKVLQQIATRLRTKVGGGGGGGAKVETQMMFSDDLGDAILKTAEDQKATLIIIGLSSKGMITRLIEGNVAQAVVKDARMPVLLLPSDWTGPI